MQGRTPRLVLVSVSKLEVRIESNYKSGFPSSLDSIESYEEWFIKLLFQVDLESGKDEWYAMGGFVVYDLGLQWLRRCLKRLCFRRCCRCRFRHFDEVLIAMGEPNGFLCESPYIVNSTRSKVESSTFPLVPSVVGRKSPALGCLEIRGGMPKGMSFLELHVNSSFPFQRLNKREWLGA